MSSAKTEHALRVVAQARKVVIPGSYWIHKKGGVYAVTGHALDTESGEAVVLYQRVGGPDHDPEAEQGVTFARPVEMWTPDRFRRVDLPELAARVTK